MSFCWAAVAPPTVEALVAAAAAVVVGLTLVAEEMTAELAGLELVEVEGLGVVEVDGLGVVDEAGRETAAVVEAALKDDEAALVDDAALELPLLGLTTALLTGGVEELGFPKYPSQTAVHWGYDVT